MRVLLRADAGEQRGTGHVMRCLTLAEGLVARGHEVALMGSIGDVGWLAEHLRDWGGEVIPGERDALDVDTIVAGGFDRVVIDSYWIEPGAIGSMNSRVPCLAIVDNDARGIDATLYLDQNLGADSRPWPAAVMPRMLAGSRYALVRDAILAHRREDGGRFHHQRPRVVAFMGGTDPGAVMVQVAESIARAAPDVELIVVTTDALVTEVRHALSGMRAATVLPPTTEVPDLLGWADVVVSAAGTSAWDICSIGRPAVLVAVAENQVESLNRALEGGLALGADGTVSGGADGVGALLSELLTNADLRGRMVSRGLATFDGAGKDRVADALERGAP